MKRVGEGPYWICADRLLISMLGRFSDEPLLLSVQHSLPTLMTERSLSSAPHDLTNSSCTIPDRLSLCVAILGSALDLIGYLAERCGLAST